MREKERKEDTIMSDYQGMEVSVKVVVGRHEAELGPGTSRLLALIDQCGSVRHAAEAMEISYGKTWKIIRAVEEALGEEVVSRQQGGPKGGSAYVTEAGRKLISRYDQLNHDINTYAQKRFKEVFK